MKQDPGTTGTDKDDAQDDGRAAAGGNRPKAVVRALLEWLGHSHTGYDYVKLGKLMASVDTAAFVRDHMPLVTIHAQRRQLQMAAFRARRVKGLVLEFGVAGGRSLTLFANDAPDLRVYGFDSFEGLPEDWTVQHRAGHFAQALPDVPANAELVVGWFDRTLPGFLEQHPGPVSFLHVDCDLYSSTKTIFDLLGDRIVPGTIILFDDYFNYPTWRQHEHKAFMEFVEANDVRFEYIGAVNCNMQVAVRIDAIRGATR